MVKEAVNAGSTVFLSSHILSEVEQLCSRLGIIREGRLIRTGGVGEMRDIKRTELVITFVNPISPESFRALDGVNTVESVGDGRTLRVTIQGAPDAIIKAAARYPVLSLTSHEPSLEDIFLRYYETDAAQTATERNVV
jgi:ABC-2 type transport system ATP-binding protein